MRVMANRTGNIVQRPLRIASLLRARFDDQSAPALQALADLGHEVVYVDEHLPRDGYRKLLGRIAVDIVVLFGNSLQNFLMTESDGFVLEELGIPYVSLWTDNPIKHLFLLKDVKTELHRGLFVPDTHVAGQLRALGFSNVFYLPPFDVTPDFFRPVAPDPALAAAVNFTGLFNPYLAERTRWRLFWDHRMNRAADSIIAEMRSRRDHVDTRDQLDGAWDPWSLEFSLIEHAMYFEQKSVMRELLIEAMDGRPLVLTGHGTATVPGNVTMRAGRPWYDLSPIYASASLNLNVTGWPTSCHQRICQAAACRSLAVSDWRDDAVRMFEPDREAVFFRSLAELPGIADRYVRDEEARRRIADAGYRRFLAHHTAAVRMAEFSKTLGELV